MLSRFARALAVLVASSLISVPAQGAILTLSVVSGLRSLDGGSVIAEPLVQESLTGTTLAQLGNPLLFDPTGDGPLGLTVRVANTGTSEVLFPEFMPGISVLTGVTGLPGYTTRTNVAAGGAAGRSGAPGADGAVSRTALDLSLALDVAASAADGSHGGGGGAGTGVADNLISVTGASGADLSAYLSGRRLLPGEWIDVPDFVRITEFHRAADEARVAIGFDLPTFSSGGISVTTGAWTGSFAEADPASPPAGPPPSVAEPGSLVLLLGGLGAGAAGGIRRRSRRERREE
jgi:hypothetical protein